jgi:hypothetical protein
MVHAQVVEVCTWGWPALTLTIVVVSLLGLLWAFTNWTELRSVSLSDSSEEFDGLKLNEENPLNIIEIGHKIKQVRPVANAGSLGIHQARVQNLRTSGVRNGPSHLRTCSLTF